MMIPVRATFRRADKPGGRAVMIDAEYADVPVELIMGTLAQSAAAIVRRERGEDDYQTIRQAMDRAEADGKIMTM